MSPSTTIRAPAFERFRAIYAALSSDQQWWDHAGWLRFAAQAAVTLPGDPRDIAAAIRERAETFHADTGWFDALHSPLRFIVAAMLVQAGDTVTEFERELPRVRKLFRETGMVRGGIYEIMAILLLRLAGDLRPIEHVRVARLHALYVQMRRYHWWLTGAHDLPTCALLIDLPGTPEEIGRIIETHYHRLGEDGFSSGMALEQAAHLLPLLRLPASQTVHRYGALVHRFKAHRTPIHPSDYQAIAILSFLDLEPETVVSRCLTLYRQAASLHPQLHHEVLIDLAADLAFLDLIPSDRRFVGKTDAEVQPEFDRIIRDEQHAAAVIACFGTTSSDPAVA